MSDKYQNKYRNESTRLQHWDYGNNAAYFITICVQNRQHFFGEIYNGKMQLNKIGIIVENEWIKTPGIRPDMNLELEEFVVMPNHFHAIIIIGENKFNTVDTNDCIPGIGTPAISNGDRIDRDEMGHHLIADISGSTHDTGNPNQNSIGHSNNKANHIHRDPHNKMFCNSPENKFTMIANKFGPQSKNLGSIVRGFKSAVTTQVKIEGLELAHRGSICFKWQTRFHDHIIRDKYSFARIQNYIRNNPKNWEKDRFHKTIQ